MERYEQKIALLATQLRKAQRAFQYIYIARLVTFLVALGLFIVYFDGGSVVSLWGAVVLFLAFLVLISVDSRFRTRSRFLKAKVELLRGEVEACKGNFSQRKNGAEYAKIDVHLMADFDIVGDGSLFQMLNRCSTRLGERLFVENLCKANLSAKNILEKQDAVVELSEKENFVQDFQVYGSYFSESQSDIEYLQRWVSFSEESARGVKFFTYFCPAIVLLWIVLYLIGIAPITTLSIPVVLNLSALGLYFSKIQKSYARLGKSAKIVKKYIPLLRLIEGQEFNSVHLNNAKSRLSTNGKMASDSLKSLFNILNLFDQNNNIFVVVVLNSLFGFSLQTYSALCRWKGRNAQSLQSWLSAISEVDSLVSYGVYRFNNLGDTIMPEVLSDGFAIDAQQVGHPLIPQNRRVSNSIVIKNAPSVNIITGANMAGKSTFLRTVAVNLMLAMNGAPVVAREFRFTPCNIISSIKIQDALSKNESYFYAEISRLKYIVDYLNDSPKTLVILDEILRGTNTRDKQIGSLGFLEKLIARGAVVFVATHDLEVGKLEDKHPQIARNYCFEVELNGEELVFDYKLKDGVSQKLNASFLLRKMGLID